VRINQAIFLGKPTKYQGTASAVPINALFVLKGRGFSRAKKSHPKKVQGL